MEVYTNYKGFGIRYMQLTGTTYVEDGGIVIESYPGYGEIKGMEAAKEFIDSIIDA